MDTHSENFEILLNQAIRQSLLNNILNIYHNNTRTIRNPNRINSNLLNRINSYYTSNDLHVDEEHNYVLPDHDDLSSTILLDIVTQFGSPGSENGWVEREKTKRNNKLKQISYRKIKEADPVLSECCSICLDDFKINEFKRTLCCKHTFHKKCVDRWFKKEHSECPMCRAPALS
jgi:hypothetical protein